MHFSLVSGVDMRQIVAFIIKKNTDKSQSRKTCLLLAWHRDRVSIY